MTDIRRHLPGIIALARAAVGEASRNRARLEPSEYVTLRNQLTEFLPPSYGIGHGVLVDDGGKESQPVDVLLYDRTLPGADYAADAWRFRARHALVVLNVQWRHTHGSLEKALAQVASVKALRPPRPIPPAPPPAPERPQPLRVPKELLPLGIIVFGELHDTDSRLEDPCSALRTALEQHPTERRPELLYALDAELAYRHPALSGEAMTADTIGFVREPDLAKPFTCYICDTKFTRRHFFYERLCPRCGDRNYRKRTQSADLHGKIALVTGARIKIGYAVALRLLRSGAKVIATTRFPRDAARRYAGEADFADWRLRLHIYGLDLRHLPSVEEFARHLELAYPRLDILVNNAAQTVWRPSAFYAHLTPFEMAPQAELPSDLRSLLRTAISGYTGDANQALLEGATRDEEALPLSTLLAHSPAISSDEGDDTALFPVGIYDCDMQQVDNRGHNSWTLRLDEVPLLELLEVQMANAVAPALLVGRLKRLMLRGEAAARYIVNVGAAEGQFAQAKRGVHPHTNMAKASLNMLTHTSAAEYAEVGIYMNSVDPGWVSHQAPLPIVEALDDVSRILPLDEVDAAARICDPIFTGEATGWRMYGNLLKNYDVAPW